MKLSIFVFATLSLVGCTCALWPLPRGTYKHGKDTIWLSSSVKLKFSDSNNRSVPNKTIRDAWERSKKALFEQNIVPWKLNPRGSNFEPSKNKGIKINKVIIKQTSVDPTLVTYTTLREGYSLDIPTTNSGKMKAGTIYIQAETSHGILSALTTLQQLFYATRKGSGNVYGKGPVKIVDQPKFIHRGVNFDVARQWYPKETIFRVLDAMSWNKFNHLHLHITDSQSWPLEIPSLPNLARKGSYSQGLTYSPNELKQILDFAEARGIKVIIEIDMPGHTTAIGAGYPNLIVGANMQPNWDKYAFQPPSGVLKLNNKDVHLFLKKLLNDLLPRLKTHSNIFHVGGDELKPDIYTLPGGLGTNDKSVIKPALQNFFGYVQSIIKKQDMYTVVWEEIVLEWNIKFNKNTIVQTWKSDAAAKEAIKKNFKVITGTSEYWYLDCGHGQWLNFRGKSIKLYYPFNDWCSPRKNWKHMYSYSPDQNLTPEEAKSVLGAEVHMWSEQTDSSSLDFMMWPRASAAAEILWSGQTDENGKNRTEADAMMRLAEMRERTVARGVGAQPITQLWCLQNQGNCEL